MIGIVVVSHSARIAEGVCELIAQFGEGRVRVAAAGGSADGIGTDAFRVQTAIESVASDDGVLVLMDLGSALLSAETALEFLTEEQRARVRLCAAPLVEGAVAAASVAAAGGSMEEAQREAERALSGKLGQLGVPEAAVGGVERTVVLGNALGLHARPAARLVRLVRRFDARVSVELAGRTASTASVNELLALGARQGARLRFRAEGAAAVEALDEIAHFVESGCGDGAATPAVAEAAAQMASTEGGVLRGLSVSAGIALGPVVHSRPVMFVAAERPAGEPDAEWARLRAAIDGARRELEELHAWARTRLSAADAEVFDLQLLLLEDPALLSRISTAIHEERRSAESAWKDAIESVAHGIGGQEDTYLRARAADVVDLAARVNRLLSGAASEPLQLSEPSIVVAHDVVPSDVEQLDPALVLGLCLGAGSTNGHAAILVRAREIPAVAGLGPGVELLAEGSFAALDGEAGCVWLAPTAEVRSTLEAKRARWLAARAEESGNRYRAATTRDGQRVRLLANLNRDEEIDSALEDGAEGVGVLRTEFLFLGRHTAPSEEEQYAVYRRIAESLGERLMVVRLLDIGGDKELPYIEIGAEENPFLGWRGLRLLLGRQDLMKTQVRAVLRAAAGHNVEVLLPMVSTPSEFRAAKAVIREAEEELALDGVPFLRPVRVGAMIEVPSAAVMVRELAREAARLSVGTNDLTQYVMAADRTNGRVSALNDALEPAVLRLLRDAIAAGHEAGIPVDLCGELGADTMATPLLLGLGVDEFSSSSKLIPELKRAISAWTMAEARAIAEEALSVDSSEAVRGILRRHAADRH